MLLVAGDQDTTTVPQASTFMRAAIPGAQLTTLTPAKHQGLLEHHAQFAQVVAAFGDACLRHTAEQTRRSAASVRSQDCHGEAPQIDARATGNADTRSL